MCCLEGEREREREEDQKKKKINKKIWGCRYWAWRGGGVGAASALPCAAVRCSVRRRHSGAWGGWLETRGAPPEAAGSVPAMPQPVTAGPVLEAGCRLWELWGLRAAWPCGTNQNQLHSKLGTNLTHFTWYRAYELERRMWKWKCTSPSGCDNIA